MPQDAFTLKFVTKELANTFIGGKISRINQPEKERLSFLIYTRSGTVKLDADFSAKFCRVSAGERQEPNPAVAPNFCMLLRKHLQNAEITAIGQVDFERVLYFDFNCFSQFESCEMRLYFEIMGKYSNAILVKGGKIVGALKTASLETAKRVTLSGAKYTLPEKQAKADPNDLAALEAVFENKNGSAAKFISDNVAGIAYTTAEEMVALYGESLSAKQVYDYVHGDEISPCITYCSGALQDFKVRSEITEKKPYSTLLQAQAAFYDNATQKKRFEDERRKLASALASAVKKTEKRLGQICEKLCECEKSEEIKLKGELITSNIYAIQRGMTTFEAVNYYDENGGKIKIELDGRLSPSQNAQRYYKKYAKLKRTAQILAGQKAETEEKADYLRTIETSLKTADDEEDLKGIRQELESLSLLKIQSAKTGKREKEQSSFRTFACGNFTVICGRNNAQNDRLTKSLSEEDLWLHVKTFHSSHTAVLTGGNTPTDEVIKFAAEVCAYYSEAQQNDKVAVDYTFKKHVKKPAGSRLGFAVYTNFKTILVAPNAHSEDRKDE